ncbi:MAG TPA: cyclic pyranopterin monophosphate synthase MoaC [Solirubrobacterales bacterium]|nr:cyclic pyranopterin monophosphate synthase MoaC [Solirubrobacterales bacterium]
MSEPESGDRGDLTHLDAAGQARMVDVGSKPATRRHARAEATVRMSAQTATVLVAGDAPKGDVIGTARLAGIQAAKRTWDLIPLAHQLPLSHVDVAVELDAGSGEARVEAEAATTAGTGVEMEALTACSVAALTIYDMVKGIERGVVIDNLRLLEKSGGKHDWQAER